MAGFSIKRSLFSERGRERGQVFRLMWISRVKAAGEFWLETGQSDPTPFKIQIEIFFFNLKLSATSSESVLRANSKFRNVQSTCFWSKNIIFSLHAHLLLGVGDDKECFCLSSNPNRFLIAIWKMCARPSLACFCKEEKKEKSVWIPRQSRTHNFARQMLVSIFVFIYCFGSIFSRLWLLKENCWVFFCFLGSKFCLKTQDVPADNNRLILVFRTLGAIWLQS